MHCTNLSNSVASIAIYLVERGEKSSHTETAKHTQQYKHSTSAVKYAKFEAVTDTLDLILGK